MDALQVINVLDQNNIKLIVKLKFIPKSLIVKKRQ